MIFKLNKDDFEILNKNVEDAAGYLYEVNEENEQVSFTVRDQDIQEVQLLINDEIVLHGMDNQDLVNDLGKKLYKIYDEILYQKNNQ